MPLVTVPRYGMAFATVSLYPWMDEMKQDQDMDDKIQDIIRPLTGKPCWRMEVGHNRSLSLGFGNKVRGRFHTIDKIYGEWEIGTYYSAWRIVKEGKVVCGSQDFADSIADLNAAVNEMQMGGFVALRQISEFDVRVEFDNDFAVDFLSTVSDGDESFHIFCPNQIYIELADGGHWKVGESTQPWTR